jgi:hypothetical protein
MAPFIILPQPTFFIKVEKRPLTWQGNNVIPKAPDLKGASTNTSLNKESTFSKLLIEWFRAKTN